MRLYLDVTDFRLFALLGKARSLSEAAARSHLSLSAASTRIRNIEANVGSKLLRRTNHGVVLTEAGEVFLKHSQSMLAQLDRLQADLADLAQGAADVVRVYTNSTAAREYLPSILRQFLALKPHVHVDLSTRVSAEVAQGVAEGLADIGIYSKRLTVEGVTTLPYRTDRFVLAVSPSHPLAGKGMVHFGDTLDYEYIGVADELSIYGNLLAIANKTGKLFKSRVRVANYDTVMRLIAENVGIGILPEPIARRYAGIAHIVQLDEDWALRRWSICVRDLDTLSPSARDLLDLLVKDGERFLEPAGELPEMDGI